jgi:hypothetical protein
MTNDTRGAVATMAALVLVAVAAALAAQVARLAATEARLVHRHHVVERGLVAVDACAAGVLATLPAGWDLHPVLAGPDGHVGSDDDGTLPAPAGCTATTSAAPGARLMLHLEAQVPGGRRRLDALVARDPAPFGDALVWLADAAALGPVLGELALEGADASVASLAAATDPEVLDAWLARQGAHVRLGPTLAPPRHAPPPPIGELDARIRAVASPGTGGLVDAGNVPPVALTFADGDLVVHGEAVGAGLLYVAGRLDIEGAMAFTGVVVARGGVRVGSGGSLFVEGALWLEGRPGGPPALDAAGSVHLRAAVEALLLADRILALPRLARILAVRDPG